MPGVVMAAARHNRPFLMIYGGTIKKGFSRLLNKDINISTVRTVEIPWVTNILLTDFSATKQLELLTMVA
jgi:dihydroxyacid dehydratase/phosphogluconate dehydratase